MVEHAGNMVIAAMTQSHCLSLGLSFLYLKIGKLDVMNFKSTSSSNSLSPPMPILKTLPNAFGHLLSSKPRLSLLSQTEPFYLLGPKAKGL